MIAGTIYKLFNGKLTCNYLCTRSDHTGWVLRRVMLPKTKADANRFAETICINIGSNMLPSKKKKK